MTPEDLKRIGNAASVSIAAGHDCVWTGNLLEPELWEALRIELQRRFRRSTGEVQATISIELTPYSPAQHSGRTAEQEIAPSTPAESRCEELVKALEQAKKRMRNCRGAIESNQVVDKDVHGSLTRGMADIDAALKELGKGDGR